VAGTATRTAARPGALHSPNHHPVKGVGAQFAQVILVSGLAAVAMDSGCNEELCGLHRYEQGGLVRRSGLNRRHLDDEARYKALPMPQRCLVRVPAQHRQDRMRLRYPTEQAGPRSVTQINSAEAHLRAGPPRAFTFAGLRTAGYHP
jgi:hypothetical protein